MNAARIGTCPECGCRRELVEIMRELPNHTWRAVPICRKCRDRDMTKEAEK